MNKTFRINKLIRDKLYKRDLEAGRDVRVKTFGSIDELISAFKEKIIEEALEVKDAKKRDELIEELADVCEVVRGLAAVLDIEFDVIEQARKEKREKSGGFDNGIFVETITIDEDDLIAQYCLARPDKYPEIKD